MCRLSRFPGVCALLSLYMAAKLQKDLQLLLAKISFG